MNPIPTLASSGSLLLSKLLTLLTSLWLLATDAAPVAREVGPIGITVADLDHSLAFYTNTLPFLLVAVRQDSGAPVSDLNSLPDARARTATLRLGNESIELTQFISPTGRSVPQDSRSFDHWFQHIAIVVRDMDAAYARLRAARVRHVSTAPQTLPAWNPDAGGIRAFYFKDPEDHVLELIQFPPGKGDPRWQRADATGASADSSRLFLGIDHTAIVVADTDRSLTWYRDTLGLRVAGHAENWGVEQEHLNQVFGARLRITALHAAAGPGIELLEYIAPSGGRPLPPDTAVNDLIAWRTRIHAEVPSLLTNSVRTVGQSSSARLVRDPDGHLLELRP